MVSSLQRGARHSKQDETKVSGNFLLFIWYTSLLQLICKLDEVDKIGVCNSPTVANTVYAYMFVGSTVYCAVFHVLARHFAFLDIS